MIADLSTKEEAGKDKISIDYIILNIRANSLTKGFVRPKLNYPLSRTSCCEFELIRTMPTSHKSNNYYFRMTHDFESFAVSILAVT